MDVSDQLAKLEEKYASVKVDKNIPLEVDLQCLTAFDPNPLENGLEADARDGIQILVNAIFECPTMSNEDGVFATLPRSVKNQVPRAKPIPKQKAMTRWEKFAAAKGIKKVKKKRVEFDENTGEYRPTFGYKNQGKSGKDLSDWIKEVPDEADPNVDLYHVEREEKKNRVAKNQMQQRRNQEEAYAQQKGTDHKAFKKQMLYKQIVDANVSTASMGKFDPKLKNDNVKVKGVKRKFESNTAPVEVEKKKNLEIAEKIGKPKKEEINVRQAVNIHSSKRRK
ncbi:Rhodanese- sulfurtransferase [Boothiomyces sp. JEL0838]|nr:Rhodanese- sulfurtransferase [Boothiomyces sp. JEL0838]